MTKIISLNILFILLGFFIYGQQMKMEQSFAKNEPCLYDCETVIKKTVTIIKPEKLGNNFRIFRKNIIAI